MNEVSYARRIKKMDFETHRLNWTVHFKIIISILQATHRGEGYALPSCTIEGMLCVAFLSVPLLTRPQMARTLQPKASGDDHQKGHGGRVKRNGSVARGRGWCVARQAWHRARRGGKRLLQSAVPGGWASPTPEWRRWSTV